MAQRLATPGVYIEEKSAFPKSVAGLPTAIPVFIGYTEKSVRDGKSLINKPVRITSIGDYIKLFGGTSKSKFTIAEASPGEKNLDFELNGKAYVLQLEGARFILYNCLELFYANGGGDAYIVAVGNYEAEEVEKAKKGEEEGVAAANAQPTTMSAKDFEAGIATLIAEENPTLMLIPEVVMLEEADCFSVQQAMVKHCGDKMKNRFAILDVYDGFVARTYDENDVITRFRGGVGNNNLDFAAAYYPWLLTSIVTNDQLSYQNVANADLLMEVLKKEADQISANEAKAKEINDEIDKISDEEVNPTTLNQTLVAVCPLYKQIINQIKVQLNMLPPSSGMAGIYATVDNARGVWKAPANLSYSSAISPSVNLTNDDQEDLNITVTGKSINAIRTFVGEGTVVWGARTLDGNSQDWRYINVRRTLIYIEQSVKYAAKTYVFEPNDSGTWILVKSMISGFLNDLWKAGGLVGNSPAEAFEVDVGLGATMTPTDILDGIMRVTVKVAVSRPAEFIVITFEQKMQES